jgi:glycosyltransferase involved in cell wall biosynthesis
VLRPPRISVITPSLNQAGFIEQTICSVLGQGYPNLEYIIIDGGSTDGTVDLIRKHERHLAYWVSEKDGGQSNAINKGLKLATGDIIAYMNSDDYYLDDVFERVADAHRERPDVDLWHGRCRIVDQFGAKVDERIGSINRYDEMLDLWDVWWKRRNFVQPEVFWTKRVGEKIGAFREDLYLVMDYEYWLRIFSAGGAAGVRCLSPAAEPEVDAARQNGQRTPAGRSTVYIRRGWRPDVSKAPRSAGQVDLSGAVPERGRAIAGAA